jgi:hypothetical protein
MKCHAILVATLFLGSSTLSQTVDLEKWNTVELLCGKLIQVQQIPEKRRANSFTEKQTPIKNATLLLYHRDKEASCCTTESLTAETVSRKDGSFAFKNITSGPYWIVGRVSGTEYKLALTYKPDSKSGATCPELSYELKNGELQLTRMVQVD